MNARRVGRLSRLGQGVQVSLAVLLAVAAAVLVVDLADWRYVRVDLSAAGRNTLDPALAELVHDLRDPVEVDVFFRPLQPPYEGVSATAQNRFLELLFVAWNTRRDKLTVTVHDPGDLERVTARQRELGVEGVNLAVFSCGLRQTTLDLFRDIASVDWGNPTPAGLRYLAENGITNIVQPRRFSPAPRDFRPAELASFRGQEAIGQALRKVSAGRASRVYFATGHGEPELEGTDVGDLGLLRVALEQDGFEVLRWDGAGGGPVPEDCAVLALIGGDQPYSPRELDAIRAYVADGGRVVGAPSNREVLDPFAGVGSILKSHGMVPQAGLLCLPITDRLGRELDGVPECARVIIDGSGLSPSHPLTEPMRRRGLRLEFSLAHTFRRGGLGPGGILLDLVHGPAEAWRDLPDANGRPDFHFDAGVEAKKRERLVMLAELGNQASSAAGDGDGALTEARVLGISSASFLTNGTFAVNREFLVHAFNWMGERHYLVPVAPRDPGVSVLDVRRGGALAWLNYGLMLGMPGLCVAIGLVVAVRRRG